MNATVKSRLSMHVCGWLLHSCDKEISVFKYTDVVYLVLSRDFR
jgi:hypothetical protein